MLAQVGAVQRQRQRQNTPDIRDLHEELTVAKICPLGPKIRSAELTMPVNLVSFCLALKLCHCRRIRGGMWHVSF